MASALHVISHQAGIGREGLSRVEGEKALWRSGCWLFQERDDPKSLVGGWIYLHETRNGPSMFGGRIVEVDACSRPGDDGEAHGVAVVFERKNEGRGQTWRGAKMARQEHGGLVSLALAHE